jgi:hypothetical protein
VPNNQKTIALRLISLWLLSLTIAFKSFCGDNFSAGPLFDQFNLTFDLGQRTEVLGPFFYEQNIGAEKTWAFPPLFSHDANPAVEANEFDFLYPLMTYENFGTEYRWQFCQLLSFSGGEDPEAFEKKRFTVFPIYFQQRSPNANENYTAFLPFYGHLKDRLFRDEIFFVMFPIYIETRKKDVVTDNYLYPFFHLRYGDKLHGWQFWPIVGKEYKGVTTLTNGFGEAETIGGHDKFFALWPIYFDQTTGIGTDNPEKTYGVLPFYSQLRSPKRDTTSVLWPFFENIDDRGQKYHEWEGPWPFVVIARGEGKTITRFWPLFSRAHNDTLESDFYLWPFYKYNRLHAGVLDQQRMRILFYLFANVDEKNTETKAERRRVDLWPLFTWHRDLNGNSRLQILAPIEPVLPNNRGIERNWSPLWSIWRAEKNPKTGATSQSFLWNLYRRDTTPASRKCSLLFGLFQYQSNSEVKKLRLLYIPVLTERERVDYSEK